MESIISHSEEISTLEKKRYQTINLIDEQKLKVKEIRRILDKKCVHCEYNESEYDDGHRWGTDYFCSICNKQIFWDYISKKSDSLKELHAKIWIQMKEFKNEYDQLINMISENKQIVRNINIKIDFCNKMLSNVCPHDIIIRNENKSTYAMYYKCSKCDTIIDTLVTQ